MAGKKWEIGAGRITTNFLVALVDAVHIKKRWKEFFPCTHLDGFVFNKADLYASIWNAETRNGAVQDIYRNHRDFFERLMPLFEKETEKLWGELKSLKKEMDEIRESDKDRQRLIGSHERLLTLFGGHAIYTPIVRFSEAALQRLLREKGIDEETTAKLIKPSYKGAQFHLNEELNSIAKMILQHPLRDEIIDKLEKEDLPEDDYLIHKRLTRLKEEYGWIKSYINFYKEVEVPDLVKDLRNLLKKTDLKAEKKDGKIPEIDADAREIVELLNFAVDMKNKIQNVQAYIFYLGNRIYSLVSEAIGIEPEQIEWLTSDEVTGLLEGFRQDKEMLETIIKKRKEGVLIDPRSGTVITDKDLIEKIFHHQNIDLDGVFGTEGPETIRGNYINKQTVKGRVFLALSHDDLDKKPVQDDSILVTRAVTPEYTPYLSKFNAVIADEGGLASHGAIVAMEMGISTIVGAQNATRILKDGDMIIMKEDGSVEKEVS